MQGNITTQTLRACARRHTQPHRATHRYRRATGRCTSPGTPAHQPHEQSHEFVYPAQRFRPKFGQRQRDGRL